MYQRLDYSEEQGHAIPPHTLFYYYYYFKEMFGASNKSKTKESYVKVLEY